MDNNSEILEERPQHPYGYIKDGKVFRKGFLNFPDREIGEVKGTEASAIAYFENRFKLISDKVNQLEQNIEESQNKGSFLMKLKHLKEQLPRFDALGDYETIFNKLEKLEQELNHYIHNNRLKNLEIKRALIAEAENYENSVDWKEATFQLQELKKKWVKTGKVTDEYHEEIENRFQQILDNFFQRKKSFFEEKQKLIEDRVKSYENILEEINQWTSSGDLNKAAEEIKKLQKKWNEIGSVPLNRKKPLQNRFKAITNKFFQELKQSKKQNNKKDPQHNEKRLAEKENLLKQAQKIAREYVASINNETVEEIKQLRKTWKTIGNVPGDRAKKMAEEFNINCDLVFEKHFLNNLARSKYKDLEAKEDNQQVKIKIQLLKDLISRDTRELEQYKENMEHFSGDQMSFNKLVNGKLRIQERKVHVKQKLLNELESQIQSQT